MMWLNYTLSLCRWADLNITKCGLCEGHERSYYNLTQVIGYTGLASSIETIYFIYKMKIESA